MRPRRQRETSRALDEVDRHRDTLELEPVAQLVLDPVAVVARHETRVVDEDAEARRALVDLRGVEEIQAAAVARRWLALRTQLLDGTGEVRRRDRHGGAVRE